MGQSRISRISGTALVVLSLVALVDVLIGLAMPPQPLPSDEGIGAHIFQLSIAAMVPLTCLYLGTADWKQPRMAARPVALAAVLTVLAFVVLYYLEHVR